MTRKNVILLSFMISVLLSCTHSPVIPEIKPITSVVTYTPLCFGCNSEPICPVTDDIIINETTTFTACAALPANQGTLTLDANHCLIWKSAPAANEIVSTCVVVCTGKICDTTLVTIFPPLPGDTTSTGNPCTPGVVYFEKDVLPILTTNCAYAGCHNATSAKEGVVLDSYVKTLKVVKPSNPTASKLYKSITDTDPGDVMPPPPSPKLTTDQINIIYKWIAQGAKDEKCDDGPGSCVTTNVSFASYVKPQLASCTTCHKTGNAGGGINLDSYSGFKNAADNGRLYGAIAWSSGFNAMPPGGSRISDCALLKIKSWIDAGAPNN